jgi:hypothetical protein
MCTAEPFVSEFSSFKVTIAIEMLEKNKSPGTEQCGRTGPSRRQYITWCGFEVAGVILLQSYLYTYSLLRGVTFEALYLSSYALSPTMLPLLETFLELLLLNSYQSCFHIFQMSLVS